MTEFGEFDEQLQQLLFWVDEGKKLGIQDVHLNVIIDLVMKYGVIGALDFLDRKLCINSGDAESALLYDAIREMLGSVCSHIDIFDDAMTIIVHREFNEDECWCVYA